MVGRTKKISPVLEYVTPGNRRMGRMPHVLLVLAWVYPFLPLGALYLTWLISWIVLGHVPKPPVDHPERISRITEVLCCIAIMLAGTSPLGILFNLTAGVLLTPWWVHSHQGGSLRSVALVAALLGIYASAFALLYSDPAGVLYWYRD